MAARAWPTTSYLSGDYAKHLVLQPGLRQTAAHGRCSRNHLGAAMEPLGQSRCHFTRSNRPSRRSYDRNRWAWNGSQANNGRIIRHSSIPRARVPTRRMRGGIMAARRAGRRSLTNHRYRRSAWNAAPLLSNIWRQPTTGASQTPRLALPATIHRINEGQPIRPILSSPLLFPQRTSLLATVFGRLQRLRRIPAMPGGRAG